MAKHHSSFERAMVLIFLVIGISAWVFSNIDLPQEELVGLAGGGFFEVFDRDLTGMAFGSQSEALKYVQDQYATIKTKQELAEAARLQAQNYQNIASGAEEGSAIQQVSLQFAEVQVQLAESYNQEANVALTELLAEQANVLAAEVPSNIFDRYVTVSIESLSLTGASASSARSSYDTIITSLAPPEPDTPADADEEADAPVITPPPTAPVATTTDTYGLTDFSTLSTQPVDEERPIELEERKIYTGYKLESEFDDGTSYTGMYVIEPRADGNYDVVYIGDNNEGDGLYQINIGEDLTEDQILPAISGNLDDWTEGVPTDQYLTPMTIHGDLTEQRDLDPSGRLVFTGGALDDAGITIVGAGLSDLLSLSRGAGSFVTTDPSPGTPVSLATATTEDSVLRDDDGFHVPKTADGIAKVAEQIALAAPVTLVGDPVSVSGSWNSEDRIFSYTTNNPSGDNYKMDYYVDDYGHLYRVIGDSTSDDALIQLITSETDVYEHEQELMYAISESFDSPDGLGALSSRTYNGQFVLSDDMIEDYLNRQDKQATFMTDDTTIKRSDVDKIYASVLGLSQDLGISSGEVMLLKKAGMDDKAIRDAYNQIPVQYRGGAAEELSKEVRAINNHLAETGKPGWTYNGGVAYSGTIGGTSVGRSAEGDVWIVLPGSDDKDPTKLYREGGGLIPKFYTLRTDGSKVYKDKGTVPKAEREALAEADREIKKISTKVEADRRAGKIDDPDDPDKTLSRAGYVQRAQMEVEYKKIEAYNQARFVGLLNSVFDKKLGAWSNGVPSKICAKVFGLDYYKQDGWTRVPENSSAYQIQSELLKNIRTVMIEGEKEEVFEGIYRYAYTIRLLTNSTVQWETYMKNSCTQETSIEVFYDYGLLYQGQHFLYHYAGSQTQDMIFEQGIDPVYLFDTACVQFDDELEPYCVSLIHGNGFATPEQGSDYDCEYTDLEDHNVQGTDDLYVYE